MYQIAEQINSPGPQVKYSNAQNSALFKANAGTAGLAANNALASYRPNVAVNSRSFAQEMQHARALATKERENIKTQDPSTNSRNDIAQNISAQSAGLISRQTGEAEVKIHQLRQKEFEKEKKQKLDESEANKLDGQELAQQIATSENTMATAVQDNQKNATEAVKEGNVGEREREHHESGNDRKKQLANWQDLAPRIIEDSKNKAVRIDIPGLYDVETLIVRMNNSSVTVQAIGSQSAMSALQSREGELRAKLSQKNVALGKLQAFDSDLIKQRMASQRAA